MIWRCHEGSSDKARQKDLGYTGACTFISHIDMCCKSGCKHQATGKRIPAATSPASCARVTADAQQPAASSQRSWRRSVILLWSEPLESVLGPEISANRYNRRFNLCIYSLSIYRSAAKCIDNRSNSQPHICRPIQEHLVGPSYHGVRSQAA